MKRNVRKLYDGAYLLEGEVGGRPLQLPLLVGNEKSILLDTGCASHVESLILPSLDELGIDPKSLTFIINTHCDVDHQGGNAGIKAAAPQAMLCCGTADREEIGDPEAIYRIRYDAYRADHDMFYDDQAVQWIMDELGRRQPPDLTFNGGEIIRLDEDRLVQIHHLPGHSKGHLGALDLKHRTLFGGDAIHGSVYLDLTGKPALCPTYLHIRPYLDTIRYIGNMDIQSYCGCHWPVKQGAEIASFCDESRLFVEKAEQLILAAVQGSSTGLTLKELCESLGPKLGGWPEHVHRELQFAFGGHLSDLESAHRIRRIDGSRPARYVSA